MPMSPADGAGDAPICTSASIIWRGYRLQASSSEWFYHRDEARTQTRTDENWLVRNMRLCGTKNDLTLAGLMWTPVQDA